MEADRAHPVKRLRPIASGELAPRVALWLAVALGLLSLLAVIPLGPASVALLALFAGLQAAYTLSLKHVVLVDVFAIAALFVIRASAGAVAVDVPISSWLYLCTVLLALFIALGKRRAELVLVESRERPVAASSTGTPAADRPAHFDRRLRDDRRVRPVHVHRAGSSTDGILPVFETRTSFCSTGTRPERSGRPLRDARSWQPVLWEDVCRDRRVDKAVSRVSSRSVNPVACRFRRRRFRTDAARLDRAADVDTSRRSSGECDQGATVRQVGLNRRTPVLTVLPGAFDHQAGRYQATTSGCSSIRRRARRSTIEVR
jgi:hypothetical protein